MVIEMVDLDNDVPLPTDETNEEIEQVAKTAKKKSRARKKKQDFVNPADGLLKAIKFLKLCQKKTGTLEQRHSSISGNWACATNEMITMGTKIEEDLVACPHTLKFEEALKKVGEDLSITQVSPVALSVKSGMFKAFVECAEVGQIKISPPDENVAVIDDRIKDAFSILAPIATEGATNAAYASVLLRAGSAVATNGYLLTEVWHGIDLPPVQMALPKQAVSAVVKSGKPLKGFGFSNSSVTFWFEDESFIKTQLFGEQYPSYETLFECENLNPWPVPDEFFKAVKAIKNFTEMGMVYFKEGKLASDEVEFEASTYTIEGLPEGMGFNSKYLLMVEKVFDKVHFETVDGSDRALFFGENTRGVVAGLVREDEPKTIDLDDEIPF